MSATLCMSSPDGKHAYEADGRCHYCPQRSEPKTFVCPKCEGSGEYQPGRDPQVVLVCRRCGGRGEVNFLDEGEAVGDEEAA